MKAVYLAIVLAPLAASVIAGLFGRRIGRAGAHSVTILGVGVSFALSLVVLKHQVIDGAPAFNGTVYAWMISEGVHFQIGFLIDNLSALMMSVVTFVSLCVHIYTIGYMHDDDGYQRFFSYIALFTFAMLMLVMANNFLQLFFGWEGVGLISYLLIGFWYTRPSATYAALKAFLINRVGDFGFLLGIATVFFYTGSINYDKVFHAAPGLVGHTMQIFPGASWSVLTVICILLFIGAMGKSAQVPLHVWLPDSMEGPTPISALIHAATMVTAGIFMVARMSPLYEHSQAALSFIIVIGAITCFFMGVLGVVQTDIKRVIAYSTLSQLGYMTTALGASAFASGIFHLMTHAFFKALLFLAAGSVIIQLHHDQDMRNMGGLRKYMPITYWTCLVGGLALSGIPGFAGYFSKDSLIEAVHASTIPGATFAYWATLISVFVTALYTFRMIFLVFHGEERMDEHTREHIRENRWVVTVPLILLAIPSVLAGWLAMGPLLFGHGFGQSLFVLPKYNVLGQVGHDWHGVVDYFFHGFVSPGLYLALAGIGTAWYFYLYNPSAADRVSRALGVVYTTLVRKYYFDELYANVFAPLGRGLGILLWKVGDVGIIDGLIVNGGAWTVGRVAAVGRRVQTGYLYHYAFTMIIGLTLLLGWLLFWH